MAKKFTTERLEAFSDGVIAIIITIMVLELKVPHGADFNALKPLLPVFLSYVLSFIYIGIYWNNHHHMLMATDKINGKILWANLHLLFWLSLVPFTTGWMGENHFESLPVALYGVNLLCAAAAYSILQKVIMIKNSESVISRALAHDFKGPLSLVLYMLGIGSAFYVSWLPEVFYVVVALIWLVPDSRIERELFRTLSGS